MVNIGYPSQRIAKGKNKLIIHVQHGLGNRLRALASATAIARQSNHELILVWEPDNHCDCHIHDLFDYEGLVLADTNSIDFDRADCYTYMEIEPNACKDKYIPLPDERDIYIRSAYVINNKISNWETENQVLRTLRPVGKVMELVNSVEPAYLGVHIRMEGSAGTDYNSYDAAYNWLPESHQQLNEWRSKSHYSRFMKRIDLLIKNDPDLKMYLAADTPETYGVFATEYGNRLSMLPRNVYDRSIKQMRYALADIILLSRCIFLLGSTWSSFSELARRFSKTICRVEMSGHDF